MTTMTTSTHEVEYIEAGKRIRRPFNADEHQQALRLCERALASNRAEAARLREQLASLDRDSEVLERAIKIHASGAI